MNCENLIIDLRKKGFTKKEIATKMGLEVPSVTLMISKLIREGRLELIETKSKWKDLSNKCTRKVIKMLKEKNSLVEIGRAIGLTRERVRQIVIIIKREHGADIVSPNESIWTTSEAAKELGVSRDVVYRCIQDGEIPVQRCGIKFLIHEEGMKVLRAHWMILHTKRCVVCGRPFKYSNGNQRVCYDSECREKYYNREEIKCAGGELAVDSLGGWYRRLAQQLQDHNIPEDEKWLTLSEAVKKSNLSISQLTHLRRRNVITIRPHLSRKWRQRLVATYAASEIAIAKEVYKNHKN